MPTQRFFNVSEEKRGRVLGAAIRALADKGLDADVASIIRDAGIPRGSFYQYFDGMEDLISYIVAQGRADKEAYLSDCIEQTRDTPFLDVYRMILRKSLELAAGKSDMTRIMAHVYNAGEKGEAYYRDEIEDAKEAYVRLLRRDMEMGVLREDIDAEELADILILFDTKLLAKDLFVLHRSIGEMEAKADRFIDMIRKGVGNDGQS
jgi:AcrR family transcriptional regulator